MKTFGESLRENAMKVIDFENKKMVPLTKILNHILTNQTFAFAKKCLRINTLMIENIVEFTDYCYYTSKNRGAVHTIAI